MHRRQGTGRTGHGGVGGRANFKLRGALFWTGLGSGGAGSSGLRLAAARERSRARSSAGQRARPGVMTLSAARAMGRRAEQPARQESGGRKKRGKCGGEDGGGKGSRGKEKGENGQGGAGGCAYAGRVRAARRRERRALHRAGRVEGRPGLATVRVRRSVHGQRQRRRGAQAVGARRAQQPAAIAARAAEHDDAVDARAAVGDRERRSGHEQREEEDGGHLRSGPVRSGPVRSGPGAKRRGSRGRRGEGRGGKVG